MKKVALTAYSFLGTVVPIFLNLVPSSASPGTGASCDLEAWQEDELTATAQRWELARSCSINETTELPSCIYNISFSAGGVL